jgi:hypothetical protein
MFDADLAMLYGVEARNLNQAVKRNRKRFPPDFMFQLTQNEYDGIRSQFVTTSGPKKLNSSQIVMSSRKHRGRTYRPYAFTEQGVAMLSSVLRSKRAVEVNIAIMRTFVQLRRLMDSNRPAQAADWFRSILETPKNRSAKGRIRRGELLSSDF